MLLGMRVKSPLEGRTNMLTGVLVTVVFYTSLIISYELYGTFDMFVKAFMYLFVFPVVITWVLRLRKQA